jgi:hypothetical protein
VTADFDIPEAILDPQSGDIMVVADELHEFRARMIAGDPTLSWPGDNQLEIFRRLSSAGVEWQIWRFWGPGPYDRGRVVRLLDPPTYEFLTYMASRHFSRVDAAAEAQEAMIRTRLDAEQRSAEVEKEMIDHARFALEKDGLL